MLTPKEIKFLNLIYFKLKGKHMDYIELWKFLKDFFRLNDDLAFELAYLYDKNFEQANGDFNNVIEPDKETYEDYWGSIDQNIKIVMEYTKDKDPNNYDESYGDVEHDGTTYRVYSDYNELEQIAIDNADWICDDPQEWAERYISMDEYSKSSFADEAADSYFDGIDDDEIIDRASIKEYLNELEEQRNELESLRSELEELKKKLENSGSEEEREEIEGNIEEVESKIEDIGSEEKIDEKIREMIYDARENLKQEYRDQIYDELDDPVEYFISNGYYNNIRQLIHRGPVEFDCDSAKEDFFRDADYDTIVNSAGYDYYEEVNYEGKSYVVVWH